MQPLFFALFCATVVGSNPIVQEPISLVPVHQSFRERTPLIQLNISGTGDLFLLDRAAADDLQESEEELAKAELNAADELLARIVAEHPTTEAAIKAKKRLANLGLKVTDQGQILAEQVFVSTVPVIR